MFVVMMNVDGESYKYGAYADENRANEVAMMVRDQRDVDTWVYCEEQ